MIMRAPAPRHHSGSPASSARAPVRALAAVPNPEPRLVHRAQRGDRLAFEDLWLRHRDAVRHVIRRKGAYGQADDLEQEVSLSALSSIRALRDPTRFRSWLCSIARNAARDAAAHRRPTEALPEEAPSRGAQTPETRTVVAETLREIRFLPEAYRRTLRMKLVRGMSGPEIASRTGMTAASVRVNLCRGMKLLRHRLGAP